jgi:hypothetical protein
VYVGLGVDPEGTAKESSPGLDSRVGGNIGNSLPIEGKVRPNGPTPCIGKDGKVCKSGSTCWAGGKVLVGP